MAKKQVEKKKKSLSASPAEPLGRVKPLAFDNLCDLKSVRVGHWTHRRSRTGCTAILFEKPVAAGCDIRGSAPGTKEVEVLSFNRLVSHIHGICFTGGSAFGLEAQSGVMRWLSERNIGFDTGYAKVPIVPAACIFDLGVGSPSHPTAHEGYLAAAGARNAPFAQGQVGAGTGATVGKLYGARSASQGGLGSASLGAGKLQIAALAVVNSYGDIFKGKKVVAGARRNKSFVNMRRYFLQGGRSPFPPFQNTVLLFLLTNASLDKEGCTKLAQGAQDALAEVIAPCHTLVDGDLAIAASTQEISEDLFLTIELGKEVVRRSVLKACGKT